MDNVKDDLDKFIALQKQRLNQEKKDLQKLRTSQNSPRKDPQEKENSPGKMQIDYQSRSNDVEGLAIGDYEKKQRKLKEERVKDYKRYAAEQEFRRTGRPLPVDGNDNDDAKRRLNPRRDAHKEAFVEKRDVTTPDIVDAYAELLRKKRAEERSYREHFDDLPVTSNRKVQFNENQNAEPSRQTFDDEDALFEWAREKAKLTNRQYSAGTSRVEKEDFVKESESKRAKSVPPNVAAGIFGGGESTTSALKRKKELYKQELELQIKEKEEQKLKEKLRRMGRLSSQENLLATNETVGIENTKIERKSKHKTDDSSPRSRRQRTPDRSSRQRQRRSKYDDRDYDDDDDEDIRHHYDERRQYRGQMPYGEMQGYDPRVQMIPPRYDMMDPYFMQRGLYGGGFPGPRGMMFGGNPALMNQMQAYNQFDFKEDRFHDEDRKRTPRSRSKQETERERTVETNKNVKENFSPRDANKSGVFGQSEETGEDRKRAAKIAYQQELKKQMQEKQEAKEKEKRERERYDAKIEAEIAIYDPWGKSGAGAPVKDQRGKVVADLRTMHKMKEEGQLITSPRDEVLMNDELLKDMTSLPKDSPVLAALVNLSTQKGIQENKNDFVNISPRGQMQSNATTGQRGAALREIQGNSQTTKQKAEQLKYQDHLKQQIEEKKRIKLEQERKEKEEEEKENRRLEEQRLKLERDFLEEQERERKKEEETRQKNDEMRKAAEQKRQEAIKVNKEIEEERMTILPPKTSSELQTHSTMIGNRSSSPPIPAIAKQQRQQQKYTSVDTHQNATEIASTDRYKTKQKEQYSVNIQQSTTQQATQQQSVKTTAEETTDSDMYYLNSIREELFQRRKEDDSINQQNSNQGTKNASETHIIKQLAALRRQLSAEETKVQNELQMNMGKYEESKSKPAPKKTKARNMEIFEKARIRKGSFSKKPPVKIDEFNKLTDASSVVDFKAKFPNKPVTSSDLDLQQREFIRLQEQKLQALRQAIRETSDNLMLDIENDKPTTEKQRRPSKQSLLESESKFINLQDEINDENDEIKSRQSSARSRQRWRTEKEEDNYLKKPKSPGGYSVGSMTSQAIEDLAAKNEARLRRFRGNDHGNDHEDPEDVIEQYMKDSLSKENRSLSRRDSEKSLPSSTALQR